MERHLRWWSVLAVVVLALGGCSSGSRASDPAGTAVREAHSSVAGLVLSVQLLLDHRAIPTVTQVSLEQTLEDVAGAHQELLTATDADPQRRAVAIAAVQEAADTLVALGRRGAAELGPPDLERLQKAEQVLAAAARELQA
ncbi:MAG TPA: hypothetical protein VGK17_19420 [Propionicimonas sp.]